jgi:hypothetical protein
MGSFGYLMAGAMAGLGKGMETVGEQSAKEQLQMDHDTTILRLQGQERERLQGLQQKFEEGQHDIDYSHQIELLNKKLGAASAAHGLTLEHETSENRLQRESAERRTHELAQAGISRADIGADARRDVAAMNAQRAAAAKPRWAIKTLQPDMPLGLDGKPDLMQPTPKPVSVIYNTRTGKTYVNQAGRLVATDTKGNPLYKSGDIGRPPAGELQDLLSDPTGLVPDGPNAGIPKAYLFEQHYHHLPAGFNEAENAARQRIGAPPAGAPSGESPPTTSNNGGPASLITQDASTAPPPFRSNADTSYANTGDIGPQASDNTPAQ